MPPPAGAAMLKVPGGRASHSLSPRRDRATGTEEDRMTLALIVLSATMAGVLLARRALR
jgi:hypothetical protein